MSVAGERIIGVRPRPLPMAGLMLMMTAVTTILTWIELGNLLHGFIITITIVLLFGCVAQRINVRGTQSIGFVIVAGLISACRTFPLQEEIRVVLLVIVVYIFLMGYESAQSEFNIGSKRTFFLLTFLFFLVAIPAFLLGRYVGLPPVPAHAG